MKLSRRDILRGSGSAIVAGGAALTVGTEARARRSRDPDPVDRISDESVETPPVAVEATFQELLDWLIARGWADYLLTRAGLDLEACRHGDSELLRILSDPDKGDFADFAGVRAIQPGDPAMSLLYHALASPEVRPRDRAGKALPLSAYPELAMIDLLENYIYARAPLRKQPGEILTLAVFAYEYRRSGKTPHGRHSDFVFSRTGVARAGTHATNWDPVARSYVNKPSGNATGDAVAVTPARYGLFLARRVNKGAVYRFGDNALDHRFDFLLPVRKLYQGCPHLHGRRLAFAEAHRDEKLARLATFVPMPPGVEFEMDRPPFVRRSASRDAGDGRSKLPGNDSALAEIEMLRGSALVIPAEQPIVQEARQGDKRARFIVPPHKKAHLGITENRRYTTLKLLSRPLADAWNFLLSDLIFGRGRHTTGLRSPRNGPVFVNIRHKVNKAGKIEHIGESRADLSMIEKGGYEAAMFLDGLCDGCVEAQLTAGDDAAADAPKWLEPAPLPAFSLVAAPDFFPRFDPVDLRKYDRTFFEGGTETASGIRLPANPALPLPGRAECAFPPNLRDSVTQTVTAALSAPPNRAAMERPNREPRSTDGINTLPDTISGIFAPGWDVTYSKKPATIKYFATFGLGSPFPEDMKLCAAANGMWAGSSPDAARTFYPDLVPFPLLGRPATAMPLTDDELGIHPRSPAAAVPGKARRGWDGEYGPFIVLDSPDIESPVGVDYADMMVSDYVLNATSGKLDLGRMRELSAHDIIERMDALKACIARLPPKDAVRNTKLWLVSVERVENWSAGAPGHAIPRSLGGRDSLGRIPAAPAMAGPGWLYVFAVGAGKAMCSEPGRRVQPCKHLFVCRIAGQEVTYARVDGARGVVPSLRWS